MTAPSPAGPERETVEALAEEDLRALWDAVDEFVDRRGGLARYGHGYLDRSRSNRIVGPVVARIVAAAVETARREGAETALREAADELEAQPPKLRAQYIATLRLYADEPHRMRVRADARTHGLNHAPLPDGVLLDPGFCAGCDAARADALRAATEADHTDRESR